MNADAFTKLMLPSARFAAKATGLPVSIVLAHWAIESAWGTSHNAKVRRNYAGITSPGLQPDGIHPNYRTYQSIGSFAVAYAALLNRSVHYAPVLKVAKQGGTVAQVARALGVSPWAAHHYRRGASGDEAHGGSGTRGTEGAVIVDTIRAHNLTRFD